MYGSRLPETLHLSRYRELVAEMMREDLKLAQRDDLARRHGHTVHDRHE